MGLRAVLQGRGPRAAIPKGWGLGDSGQHFCLREWTPGDSAWPCGPAPSAAQLLCPKGSLGVPLIPSPPCDPRRLPPGLISPHAGLASAPQPAATVQGDTHLGSLGSSGWRPAPLGSAPGSASSQQVLRLCTRRAAFSALPPPTALTLPWWCLSFVPEGQGSRQCPEPTAPTETPGASAQPPRMRCAPLARPAGPKAGAPRVPTHPVWPRGQP